MMDLGTICLFGFIIIIGLIVLMMVMRNSGSRYPDRGYRPTYDDPDVESRGGFGRNRSGSGSGDQGFRPEYDDPDVESRGGFGRDQGGSSGGSSSPKNPSSGFRSGSKGSSSSSGGSTPKSSSGGFRSSPSKGSSSSGGSSSPRNDSPDVNSRGGFGRNKK